MMLFWKAALLAPVVLIEQNTFVQMLGISCVQFVFGVFLFVREPSIFLMVDLKKSFGAEHQMLALGIMALNVYLQVTLNSLFLLSLVKFSVVLQQDQSTT